MSKANGLKRKRVLSAAFTNAVPDVALCEVWELVELSGRTKRIREQSEWIKTKRVLNAAFTNAVPDVALCEVWEPVELSGRRE